MRVESIFLLTTGLTLYAQLSSILSAPQKDKQTGVVLSEKSEKMAENVRVIVRCRPPNSRENAAKIVVHMEECTVNLEHATDAAAPVKQFRFDGVYGPEIGTEVLYNDVCFPIVEGCLEGFNGTIFAYGQTGCGKSFTMGGTGGQRGVISRALEHIFEATLAADSDTKYLLLVSHGN